MSMGDFISIQPSELKFPFDLRKQSSCSMQLSNKTDQFIAFKVKTTNPKKYSVRPNAGVILPNSVCNVTVTMQAQKEVPSDMQCRDKFLIQSVVAPQGSTSKDVNQEMFNREDGKVDEFKLRVVYIPANPPSPVPEGDEEGTSPRTSSAEEEIRKSSLPDAVARSLKNFNALSSEESSVVSKLNKEKASVIEQNKRLLEELELVRKQARRGQSIGSSIVLVVCCLVIGILVGYYIRK